MVGLGLLSSLNANIVLIYSSQAYNLCHFGEKIIKFGLLYNRSNVYNNFRIILYYVFIAR